MDYKFDESDDEMEEDFDVLRAPDNKRVERLIDPIRGNNIPDHVFKHLISTNHMSNKDEIFKNILLETSTNPNAKKSKTKKNESPPSFMPQRMDIEPANINPEDIDNEILNQVLMDSINQYEHAPTHIESDEDILNKIISESIETARLEEIARGDIKNSNIEDEEIKNSNIKDEEIKNSNIEDEEIKNSNIEDEEIKNPENDDLKKLTENEKNILLKLLFRYDSLKKIMTENIQNENSYNVIFNVINNNTVNIEHLNEMLENDYIKYLSKGKKTFLTTEQYTILLNYTK